MSVQTKRGLGRGFESLLPSSFDKDLLLSPKDRIEKISLGNILPNPHQPRKHFDKQSLVELAESIKRYGIIQPLLVTPDPDNDDGFIIVAGERRWRAAKLAKLAQVPVVVHQRKELEQIELALIENIQRVDLNPMEQAISFEKLHQQLNMPYAEIARNLGKSRFAIDNIVRLLKLPDNAKQAVMEGKIAEGHARQILSLEGSKEHQDYLLNAMITHHWTVRQAEQYVTSVKSGMKEVKKAHERTSSETEQTKTLSKKLKTPVTLRRMAHGGKLEITYRNDIHLEELISRIS